MRQLIWSYSETIASCVRPPPCCPSCEYWYQSGSISHTVSDDRPRREAVSFAKWLYKSRIWGAWCRMKSAPWTQRDVEDESDTSQSRNPATCRARPAMMYA
eukprot:scaffold1895_cov123-Isochrysis_galbana.AAC.13